MNPWYEPYRVKIEGDSSAVRKIFNRDWFGLSKFRKKSYFVMGDNRDVSEDSRYWGFLERKKIHYWNSLADLLAVEVLNLTNSMTNLISDGTGFSVIPVRA